MYLYLYFKYFFGWLLVLVLKILLQSILPNTVYYPINGYPDTKIIRFEHPYCLVGSGYYPYPLLVSILVI